MHLISPDPLVTGVHMSLLAFYITFDGEGWIPCMGVTTQKLPTITHASIRMYRCVNTLQSTLPKQLLSSFKQTLLERKI